MTNHVLFANIFLAFSVALWVAAGVSFFLLSQEDPNLAVINADSENDASCVYTQRVNGEITCTFFPETSSCTSATSCTTYPATYECNCPINYAIESNVTTYLNVFNTVSTLEFVKDASSVKESDISAHSSQNAFGVNAIELCAVTRCHRYNAEFEEDNAWACSLNLVGMQQSVLKDNCIDDEKEDEACWATSILPFHCNLTDGILYGAHVEQMKAYAKAHTSVPRIIQATSSVMGIICYLAAVYLNKLAHQESSAADSSISKIQAE